MSGAEILYVSWGGNGRGLALRAAFEAALERDAPLLYLAILDEDHFGDLDKRYIGLVIDELEWLLDAQVRLVADQVGGTDHEARILVRHGSVYDEISDVVKASEAQLVLVPNEVSDMLDQIVAAAGVEVDFV